MKTLAQQNPFLYTLLLFSLGVLFFSGCSTTKNIDWETRVGTFTYDQAIAELGPPDKQAKLSDGKTVAEWITRRSGGTGFSVGTGFYGRHTGVGVGHTVGSGYPDRMLRLTFSVDGKLSAYWKNY